MRSHSIIIGAGPAGLATAYELSKKGGSATVFEKDLVVGGLSRTVERDGFRFDIGGHRFFTKARLVQEFWQEILGDDLLTRSRLSRIYYDGKFFHYPLRPLNALKILGPVEAVRIGLSYVRAHLAPDPEERSLEQWVSNRFGRRLYEIFFKTYTEKVWGMPCSEISADWAAQRIKNLDLIAAVKNALLGSSTKGGQVVTTLIDSFLYPRFGPGMMWERCTERLEAMGVPTHLGTTVERLHHQDGRIAEATIRDPSGRQRREAADHFVSSMPLRELVRALDPPAPGPIRAAADRLRYRDFVTVVLFVNRRELFPDNWIYIHAPEVQVGRIQNYKNWSPEMVSDDSKTSVGLEYFVQENDGLWSASDDSLVELGTREVESLGLVDSRDVEGGCVVRAPKAYPVYDDEYKESVGLIRGYLEGIENLQAIGRNGQHRYNNQDHSMLTGFFAARNIMGAEYDVWNVNAEAEYHEEVVSEDRPAADRMVPQRLEEREIEEIIGSALSEFDPVALGGAVGFVAGIGLIVATVALLLGPEPRGPNLSLLGNYLLGFRVTWGGMIIGALEAVIGGYLLGNSIARSANLLVRWFKQSVERRLELSRTMDPLEVTDS